MRHAASCGLHGLAILVVEDDYHLAQELCLGLADAGVQVIGPAPGVAEAMHLLAAHALFDAAVMDVNLGGTYSWPVVDMLLARQVPVLIASGYDSAITPAQYKHLPRCEKPFTLSQITTRLTGMIAGCTRTA